MKNAFRTHTTLLALVLATAGTAALAQSHGDRKCGPDGRVMEFYDPKLSGVSGRWERTQESCSVKERGGPADGETRCGADGWVQEFEAKYGKWMGTTKRCK